MENSGVSAETVKQSQPGSETGKTAIVKINHIFNLIGVWLFRLRKFVLAAPVVYYAMKLASYNMEHLPEQVGINLQSSGEFASYIARSMAVTGPFGLTIACLLLMFCSRKALYPWAISVFTLVLPLLLLFSNAYPA